MTALYLDASALVKLVRDESGSAALRRHVDGARLVSSELVRTEVPRAVRRAAADDPGLPLDELVVAAGRVIDALTLITIDRGILAAAGALREPALRALDAIHIVSAVDAGTVDAFVTYDARQAAAARLVGLRTVAPGA
ncbi:MAG: type II toxin-antitoxin system VapC family toxin [Thermoleophilia bacterium]|nr:type II toxin-antitoxin system VapC family toxin [Thermoleophilia bacterium]